MNSALEIISLQHELAMAINNELNLNATVANFMHVCLKRFRLRGVHTFLNLGESSLTLSEPEDTLTNLEHYLSIPIRDNGKQWSTEKGLKERVLNFASTDNREYLIADNRHFYFFSIPQRGVLVFESECIIPAMVRLALPPVLAKFSSACAATYAYEMLENEVVSRRAAEKEVFHQANHDALTQLSNRHKLNHILAEVLVQRKKDKQIGAILFIDLNQFKSINDLMGHDVGDQILQSVGQRLLGVMKAGDLIARFGGDEFIYLAKSVGKSEDEADQKVKNITSSIVSKLTQVYCIGESCYSVGCSIGYELFPRANCNVVELIRNADVAMYEAKRDKSRPCVKYSEDMSKKLLEKTNYTRDLKAAISNNEFDLHYQPVVDKHDNIVAAEALLRWTREHYGPVSPAEYIPIAEESDLIYQISDWVLERVFRDAKILYEKGIPSYFRHFAVNISGRELNRDGFVKKFIKLLKHSDIPPSLVSIEITENTLINNIEHAIEAISVLSKMGVHTAIDDFGTGYSSLTYLKKLPVSSVKLDRTFVSDIHSDPDNQSIARMVLALGDNFGLQVVSEGIEKEQELNCLIGLGFDQFQGFYFHRPAPISALTELLT